MGVSSLVLTLLCSLDKVIFNHFVLRVVAEYSVDFLLAFPRKFSLCYEAFVSFHYDLLSSRESISICPLHTSFDIKGCGSIF